jgi:WD40 repeat protein
MTGAIQVWEVVSGKLVCEFHHERLFTLAFSPDGRFLLTGGDSARLWDVLERKAIDWTSPDPGRVGAVTFSRDGQMLLTGGLDKVVRLWDAATRRPIGEALSHTGPVKAIALSPDDQTIVSATGNGLVYRWDRATRAPLGRPLQPQDTRAGIPCFGPDGRIVLFVFGDGSAQLRDVVTGRHIGPPLRHFGEINAIAFALDGRSLLTRERDNRTALLWEVPAPLNIETDHVACWIEAITGLVTDTNGTMHVLDAPRWRERQRRLLEIGGSP